MSKIINKSETFSQKKSPDATVRPPMQWQFIVFLTLCQDAFEIFHWVDMRDTSRRKISSNKRFLFQHRKRTAEKSQIDERRDGTQTVSKKDWPRLTRMKLNLRWIRVNRCTLSDLKRMITEKNFFVLQRNQLHLSKRIFIFIFVLAKMKWTSFKNFS